jgi:hypothetical protein
VGILGMRGVENEQTSLLKNYKFFNIYFFILSPNLVEHSSIKITVQYAQIIPKLIAKSPIKGMYPCTLQAIGENMVIIKVIPENIGMRGNDNHNLCLTLE